MSKDDTKKFNRRELIKSAFLVGGSLTIVESMMLNTLLGGFNNIAQAGEVVDNDNILVLLAMSGGFPKWYYDMPIRPNGNDAFIPNEMVKTKLLLDANGKLSAELASHLYSGYHLPYLWASDIPTTSGQNVPMTNILKQALMIRGYDLINDGHDQNLVKHNCPVSGGLSLSGLLSDNSDTIFPTIHTNNRLDHKSQKGKNSIAFPSNRKMSAIFAAFNLDTSLSSKKRILDLNNNRLTDKEKNINNFFKTALTSLKGDQAENKKRRIVEEAHESALNLLKKDWSTLDAEYTQLVGKYENLVQKSLFNMNLEGIDDIPLIAPYYDTVISDKLALINTSTGKEKINLQAEVASMINEMRKYGVRGTNNPIYPDKSGVDIRSLLKNSTNFTINQLSHSFAVSEYLITNNLSRVALMTSVQMLGANKTDFTSYDPTFTTRGGIDVDNIVNHDAHYSGVYSSLYFYSQYYRAVASCLNEFIEKMKSSKTAGGDSYFSKMTIMQFTEFNRTPNVAGTGSDHGYKGCSATIFSGKFKAFNVIGDITHTVSGNNTGTWGLAAVNDNFSNRTLSIGNVASTVSLLTGIKSPTQNDMALVKNDPNGGVVPLWNQKPKNVGNLS